ncbi:hypothetical protein [Verrucomicrobium sp. BvORR106]|uniref:hypothetical protein n=1 Tax=Verrucomicrobium sp. BvORR106 TaxID=1403819 RepID=UPI0005716F1F|nr:hypothetical protein [Verrucomicrobium sp. BvORR106]
MQHGFTRQIPGITFAWGALITLGAWLGSPNLSAQVTTRSDEVGKLILKWHGEGTAAGLNGFRYENRDGGHSQYDVKVWPQVDLYQPTAAEKERKADVGPANQVRPFPVLGNCSMSAPADKGGSLPRLYMGNRQGFEFLNAQYLGNNLYFYPEHQDYDPGWNGRNGWGDLYAANTPFVVISQGSSFTDQPFLQAFFGAAAALPPETQQLLLRNRILAPTLQAIFRKSNRMVKTEADYFTGAAHPPVFDGGQIDETKMVTEAHDMLPPLIPPVAILEVLEETGASANKDFFELDAVTDEKLGNVPGVIARVFRGSAQERQIVVTARKSPDLMRRPLTYKWVLLQGDPDRVKIEPQGNGDTARITVKWQSETKAATGITSHRVDVGVFVGNGVSWSAPAFVCFAMPANEMRFYDGEGRIQEICYDAGNPDLGMPATTDLRWLALGRRLGGDGATRGIRLVTEALGKEAVTAFQALAADLAPAQEAWRKLSAGEDKAAAEQSQKNLQEALKTKLTADGGTGKSPLAQQMERAISQVADRVDLWSLPTSELQSLIGASSKSDAKEAVKAAQQRLVDYGVLRERDGSLTASWQEPGPAIRYQLRQYNLTLLSQVLLPEFLERTGATAYVDPLLTARKAWRDVYVYDKQGLCQGWTRYSHGRTYEFDLEGWLLPRGRGEKSVAVKYVKDEAAGTLIFVPR